MGIINDAILEAVSVKQTLVSAGATEQEVNEAVAGVIKSAAALFAFPVMDTVFGPFKLDVDHPKMEAFLEGVGNAVAPIIPAGTPPL